MSWSQEDDNFSGDEFEYKSGPQPRKNKNFHNSMRLRERRPRRQVVNGDSGVPHSQMGAQLTLRSEIQETVGGTSTFENSNPSDSQRSKRLRNSKSNRPTYLEQLEIDRQLDELDREHEETLAENGLGEQNGQAFEDDSGVFNPPIDLILWRRPIVQISQKLEEDSVQVNQPPPIRSKYEYFVKFKEYSYLHCEWIAEDEILGMGKLGKNRLQRFNKQFNQKLREGVSIISSNTQQQISEEPLNGHYFEQCMLDIDKVLYCTEIFPVIHPKKANELKGKWSDSLAIVTSKLLNFSKDGVHYGVFFMEPVDPDSENCSNYYRVIAKPMDLGTLNNKVYLDNYRSFKDFWADLGLVFSNCRYFNEEPDQDIRILCDTLREFSRQLYGLWHAHQKQRYQNMLDEVSKRREELMAGFAGQKAQMLVKISFEVDTFIERLFELIQKGMVGLKAGNRGMVMECRKIYVREISFNSGVFGEDRVFISNLISQIDGLFSSQHTEQTVLDSKFVEIKTIVEKTASDSKPKIAEHKVHLQIQNDPQILSISELETYNPGEQQYGWLRDHQIGGVEAPISPQDEPLIYFSEEDFAKVVFEAPKDKLYLVKWRNMSYLESTWEFEGDISNPQKVTEFRHFNRAVVKDIRQNYSQQLQRHRLLLEINQNSRKRSKMSYSSIQDIISKLFQYNYKNSRPLFQYTLATQPIFKDRKLLRPYQLDGVNWIIESWYNGRNSILADEMGLGKTIQSIAFINYLSQLVQMKGPFLVVAPLSTLEHWKRTVEQWSNLNCVLYYDLKGVNGRKACRGYEWYYTDISVKGSVLQSAEICKFSVIITSFEVFLQDISHVFMNIPFQQIIIDEAHRLKNKDTKLFSALKRLPCKRVLLLTGTPIQNNTLELWSLLNFIEPEIFYSSQDFLQKFGDLSNADQVKQLHTILRPYLLRRMKEEVESSIPPLQETIIDVEMTTIQKTIYRAIYERNRGMLIKGSGIKLTSSLNNLEMQLRKCCNHPFMMRDIELELTTSCISKQEYMKQFVESSGKMILLDKLLTKMKLEKRKVLIFSQFTIMLALLEKFLIHFGYKYEKIDGSVKAKERSNSIDRFNNPDSQRDVFLLSTKAGGLGINLTSANTVIIYDSDWNPQNDVQATARAHRIGQQSEVQVYRLVTKNTYEAEMFEKACKKLGLDQAIFMAGAFEGNPEKFQEKSKTIKKEELELILKKGIIGLIDDEVEGQQFKNQDINEILKNSRVARHSVVSGTCTYSKSSFTARQTDSNIQVDDPNFWNIVFKNTQSESLKITKMYDKIVEEDRMGDLSVQRELIHQVYNLVHKIIDSKMKIQGYSTEDESNLNELLTKMIDHPQVHSEYKDLALLMSSEIFKPSRRFKRIDLNALNLHSSSRRSKVAAKQPDTLGLGEEDGDDALFGGESGSEKEALSDHILSGDEDALVRLSDRATAQGIKSKLCSLCLRRKVSVICQGYCQRAFHSHCLELWEKGVVDLQSDDHYKDELEENKKTDQQLRDDLDLTYMCKDCESGVADCFKCHELGEVNTEEIAWRALPSKKPENKATAIMQCNKCFRLYHKKCLHRTKSKLKKGYLVRCQQHYCHKCRLYSDKLYRCLKCPVAYHAKCMKKSEIKIVTGRMILCGNHDHAGSKKKKVSEVQGPNARRRANRRVKTGGDLEGATSRSKRRSRNIAPSETEGGSKKKEANGGVNKGNLKLRKATHEEQEKTPLLTYEQLELEDPIEIDYSLFSGNWCKYCGARYSSQFYSGPWGPKSLCKPHYDLHRLKKLNIGKIYDKNPSAPLNMDMNTELEYLSLKKFKSDNKKGQNTLGMIGNGNSNCQGNTLASEGGIPSDFGNSKFAQLAKLRPSKKFK